MYRRQFQRSAVKFWNAEIEHPLGGTMQYLGDKVGRGRFQSSFRSLAASTALAIVPPMLVAATRILIRSSVTSFRP
jgi:hypothetical protein